MSTAIMKVLEKSNFFVMRIHDGAIFPLLIIRMSADIARMEAKNCRNRLTSVGKKAHNVAGD